MQQGVRKRKRQADRAGGERVGWEMTGQWSPVANPGGVCVCECGELIDTVRIRKWREKWRKKGGGYGER